VDPRAEIYSGLSECFKEPNPGLARDVASGLLRDVLSRAFAELDLVLEADGLREVGTEEEVLDRLCRGYRCAGVSGHAGGGTARYVLDRCQFRIYDLDVWQHVHADHISIPVVRLRESATVTFPRGAGQHQLSGDELLC